MASGKKYSTNLALIQFYDKITCAIDNKEHLLVIYWDLSIRYAQSRYSTLQTQSLGT